MKSSHSLSHLIFFRLASLALPISIWQLLAVIFPEQLVPGPLTVVEALAHNVATGVLFAHLLSTVRRVLTGLLLALIIGMFVGLLMGVRKLFNDFLDPVVIILIAFPSVSWAVMALIWFGLSELSVVFFVVVICAPVFAIGIREGVKAVDHDIVRMSRSFGHSSWSIIKSVVMPTIYPYLLAASRYGLGLAWKLTIIAELLGMPSGVGYQLGFNYGVFRMDQVFAWTLSFAIVILVSDSLFLRLMEKRLLNWRGEIAT
ncbi:MAG: ABC transporter permease [Candidatus Caldarchaeum sp.]